MTEITSCQLVRLKTDKLTLSIKGLPCHPAFSDACLTEKTGNTIVICDDSFALELFSDYEISKHKGNIASYRHIPLFFEQQNYELVIKPADGHTAAFWHENKNVRKNITGVDEDSGLLTGNINFGNDIGLSDLIIFLDGKEYLKLTIEVFPSKISYMEDYKAIIEDVTSEVYNLVFDFLKKTYSTFDIADTRQSSPVEFFTIIRQIYRNFLKAADMVIQKPHHLLETEHEVLPSHKIKRTDRQTLRWIEKHPEQACRNGDRVMVSRALGVRKHVTYNTKENQLTKYMLMNTEARLISFRDQYLNLKREADDAIIAEINGMIREIHRRYSTGFFKEVDALPAQSGMSLVFGMAPGYRELYRYYLMLRHGLSVTGSIFNISVKDIALLYEYWCFIKLNSIMKQRYHLKRQDILKVDRNGLFVTLKKGVSSKVEYENPLTKESIILSYNPKSTQPTVNQKPDNVLSLKKRGTGLSYEYIFDAKYKINPAIPNSAYAEMYGTPGPQEEDINTMHRYRDAIVSKNGEPPFERFMFGAYVLFPYQNEKEDYNEHHFYKSIEKVNVGGLPFLPSQTDMVTELLDELIDDSVVTTLDRVTLPRGLKERIDPEDWEKRDVLVTAVRSDKELDGLLKTNKYRIPKAKLSYDSLPVHYIALYQTKADFADQSGIRYYGEVLMTSVQNDEYCFTVRKWNMLEHTIRTGESDFECLMTNLYLLKHANYATELSMRSEGEYRFFKEMERRVNVVKDLREMDTGFEMNGIKIYFQDGWIKVFGESGIDFTCELNDFVTNPSKTFRKIMNSSERIHQ